MLAIPGPATVAEAAANLVDAATRGGVADLRRMPAALIDHGAQRNLYRCVLTGRAARGTTWRMLDELLDARLQRRGRRGARRRLL